MVPDITVTVLAFRACFVSTDPNWNIALRLSLTFAGSNSVSFGPGGEAASHHHGEHRHSK